jgi:hypothetical protein
MEQSLRSINLLFTRRKPTAPTYRLPFPTPSQPFRIHPISSRESFGRWRPRAPDHTEKGRKHTNAPKGSNVKLALRDSRLRAARSESCHSAQTFGVRQNEKCPYKVTCRKRVLCAGSVLRSDQPEIDGLTMSGDE